MAAGESIPMTASKRLRAGRTVGVGELLEGIRRTRRVLVSPEGVGLDIQVAGLGERLSALFLDLVFITLAVVPLYLLALYLFISSGDTGLGLIGTLFLAFLVRNLYFLHFELTWQGRTPGKRLCHLRVINRQGGELSPGAVVARNLTREVELFLPLSMILNLGGGWSSLATLGWVLVVSSLPVWNRDRLRVGDLIGGTQVIALPRRRLQGDLSQAEIPPAAPGRALAPGFTFTPEQLAIYGAFELQVLEEFLRRPPNAETRRLLSEVAQKIQRKIDWPEPVPAEDVRRFLTDFYTAERADLERGQLFGRLKVDQTDQGAAPGKTTRPGS